MAVDPKLFQQAQPEDNVQFLASVILHLLDTQLDVPGAVPPSTYARLYAIAQAITPKDPHHDQ